MPFSAGHGGLTDLLREGSPVLVLVPLLLLNEYNETLVENPGCLVTPLPRLRTRGFVVDVARLYTIGHVRKAE